MMRLVPRSTVNAAILRGMGRDETSLTLINLRMRGSVHQDIPTLQPAEVATPGEFLESHPFQSRIHPRGRERIRRNHREARGFQRVPDQGGAIIIRIPVPA